MERINNLLITAMVLLAVGMFANADIPPAPVGLNTGTDNDKGNYLGSAELNDPYNAGGYSFITGEDFKFIVYYGWLNRTTIDWNNSGLTLVIVADDNPDEIQLVREAGVDVYFYIAMGSTYGSASDKSDWEQGIKDSIDCHSYVDGFFWDEVDPGYYGQDKKIDFNQRLTEINFHVHSKGQNTIANGVRYYADHCGSDYYMWESFMSSFTWSPAGIDYYYVDFFNTTGSNSDPYQWINNIDKWEYLQNSSVLNKTLAHCYGDPIDDDKSNYDYIAARVVGAKGFSYVDSNNFASTPINLTEGMRWDLGTQFDYAANESNETLSGRFANGRVEDDVGQTVSTGNAVYSLCNDNTPPASITDLDNVTYEQTCINWTWTDPADTDFEKVTIYLDGVSQGDVPKGTKHYNATGLTADTEYTISMYAADTSGNVNETWVNDTARTEPSPDITAPIITNITNATPAYDSVTITWATDENSDGLVKYGTVKGTYDHIKSDATMVTSHTVTLTGLNQNTVYYFVVNSTDSSGNSNESTEYNFTPASTNGSMSGIVTDSITGCLIRAATVFAGTMSARTGGDGTYLISSIAHGTYSLNATATGYAWNNSTVVVVPPGVINTSGNVTLTPEKVTLSLESGETTIIKSALNGTPVIFNLSANNYGTSATFTVTNSSNSTVVTGCGSFVLNSEESKDFNIIATGQTAGYYPVTITVANSSSGKSASITLYATVQNMSANYTADRSTVNTTNNARVTGSSVLVNSTVDTGANVNGSTLVHANVTEGANVTGGSLVQHSNVTGNMSSVGNGSVVKHSTVNNSMIDNGAIVNNSTVTDSVVDNTTVTGSELYGNTTVTNSTIVNVTANEITITDVEIDTGYDIILINATVKASTSSGTGGRPEIQGNANANVITRGVNFTSIYADVLIEDLILQQTDDKTVPKNTSTKINASDTVKCDIIVNMTGPARINITETGINPEGEGTESILSGDVSDWIPVGSFICIHHNTSGTGSFTIRRYYDPSPNYTKVYIYYYNTTPHPNVWERLEITANGTLGGLYWIEAVGDHLSTFILMGTLGGGDDGDGGNTSGGGGTYPPGWFGTPAPALTATKVTAASPGGGTTDAPPGERVTPAATKMPAAAKVTAKTTTPTAEGTANKDAPGFTAVFLIAGMLAVAYAMMRRRA